MKRRSIRVCGKRQHRFQTVTRQTPNTSTKLSDRHYRTLGNRSKMISGRQARDLPQSRIWASGILVPMRTSRNTVTTDQNTLHERRWSILHVSLLTRSEHARMALIWMTRRIGRWSRTFYHGLDTQWVRKTKEKCCQASRAYSSVHTLVEQNPPIQSTCLFAQCLSELGAWVARAIDSKSWSKQWSTVSPTRVWTCARDPRRRIDGTDTGPQHAMTGHYCWSTAWAAATQPQRHLSQP